MTLLNEELDEETTAAATATGGDDGGDDNGGNNGAAAAAAAAMPGNVRASDIVGEMQTAYLDYAMSVIVSRALPDVRDGLKPVHRRILYAMSHDLYLHHTKPHRKSARIVGEVLGKYHPHGDVAVYDAMVRMAQEFSLRYPLIDGQGNFGSIDGDGAAAMRYTEARLAEIAELMLADLDKDTVEWHDNFDNSLEEPDILPAALPNLLINGSSGIAVGMATNIPPHNLGEIVDALVYLIDRYKEVEEITVDDLLQFVKGPDFPTGGILYRFREDKADEHTDVVAQGYAMGRARLVMQAKAHFEEMSRGRSRIVVTELPYQTNKTALIERIATLARDGKIEGITDLRDESDRSGMRIVVELTRNADPKDILKDLFKYTPLQQTFGMQMLALVDGQPRLLSLKRALHLFVQHREEIIRRRSEYDLAKARDRAHIVEGLLKALDILDEVIDTIRRSQTVETARNNLVKNFKFTEIQAQAILDMQLRRLAALERKKLKEEYDALMERIAYLEDLLAHPEKILAVIREDLLAQKEKYGDARRTQIVDRTKGTLTSTDLLPQQDVWVTVSEEGDLRRQDVAKPDVATLRKLAKYGRVAMLTANTRDWLYLFCRDGRCTRVPIHELPQNGTPKHVSELTDWGRRDTITAALSVPRISPVQAQGYLFLATALGDVKRVTMADFVSNNNAEFTAIAVDPKDRLGWVFPTPGEQEVMLITGTGQSIRFSEEDVRSMGLAAGGVGGIKLKKNDTVIHADLVEPESAGTVLTMTAQGYAKRSALSEYNRQGRNGSGIVTHKPTNRTGNVTAALILEAGVVDEEVIATITAKRKVDPIHVRDIPVMGRGVQGKQVIALSTGDQVAALKRILESTTPTGSPFDGTPDNGNGSNGSGPIAPSSNGSSNGSGSATNGTGSQETTGRGSANGATAGKTTAKRNTAARKRSTKSSSQVATPVAQQQSKPKRAKHSSTKETTVKEATVKAIATETVAPSTTTPLTTTPSTINGAQEATTRKQPQAKQRTRKQSRAKAATTRTAASTATHRGQTEAAKEQKGAVSTAKATGKTTAKAAPTAKETAKEKTTASATATAKHRQPKAKRQAATSTTDASTQSGTPRAVKDKTKSTREPSTTTEPASKKTTQKKATQKKAVAAKTSSTNPATTKAATAKNAAAKATKSATSQQKKPKSGSDKVTRVATGAGNSKTSARSSTGTNKSTTKRATKKDATATVVGSKAETTKRTAKQTAKNPPAKRSAKRTTQAEPTPAKRTAVTAKKKPATAKQRKLQTATSVPKAGKRA